jgi:predicted dehydrogenase
MVVNQKNSNQRHLTRRNFIGASASLAAFTIVPRSVLGGTGRPAPSDRLNIAGIGVGGQGRNDLVDAALNNNVVALCDVDENMAGATFVEYPKAKLYKDFRNLLEKEQKNIDAVTIAVPDHMHATAALMAMERGKHVYLEAPLAQTVWEARLLTKAAAKYKVATQMGNQGYSSEATRVVSEVIESGDIGEVTEVHAWNNGGFTNSVTRWPAAEKIPDTLQWNLWLGRAQQRDYNPQICPYEWRGYQSFGSGSLGDWGIHIMGAAHWALKLGSPAAAQCLWVDGRNEVSYAAGAMIKYEFAARVAMPAVKIYWYGGTLAKRLDFSTLLNMVDSRQNQEQDPNAPATANTNTGANTGTGMAARGRGQTAAQGQRQGQPQASARAQWQVQSRGQGAPFIPSGLTEQNLTGFNQIFIGTKGYLCTGGRGDSVTLFPNSRLEGYKLPKPTLSRSPGHIDDWLAACKSDGRMPCSNFGVSGPYTEWLLLGNIAEKFDDRLEWDSANLRFTNNDKANEHIQPQCREGWEIKDV